MEEVEVRVYNSSDPFFAYFENPSDTTVENEKIRGYIIHLDEPPFELSKLRLGEYGTTTYELK